MLNTDVQIMPHNNKNSTSPVADLIPKLIQAGFSGNRQDLRLLSLNAVRVLRAENPETAKEITGMLAELGELGSAVRRVAPEPEPIPADQDAGMSLLKTITLQGPEPILSEEVQSQVELFLKERTQIEVLLSEGYLPPRTILLKGPPGTGKTTLARSIAAQLGLRLVVLDLATAISSFLGKTGLNLRRSLDYARSNPCVLLLDELDAVAKRRDDSTDVGELNRIVNVLLKELEDWPMNSVLIGATNHPEILDKAVHRRFDVVLEIPLPASEQREAILQRSCGQFAATLPRGLLRAFSQSLSGLNGSELETISQAAVRRHLVENIPLSRSLAEAVARKISATTAENQSKKNINSLISVLQRHSDLTVREMGAILGLSPSAVQYHLTKEKKNA